MPRNHKTCTQHLDFRPMSAAWHKTYPTGNELVMTIEYWENRAITW